LQFFFDESVERHDRIERILQELQAERTEAAPADETVPTGNDERDDD
jgi:hypothetical protein